MYVANFLGSYEADYLTYDLHGPCSVSNTVAYIQYLPVALSFPSGCEEGEQGPFPGLVVHLLACLGVQGRSPGQQQQAASTIIGKIASLQEVVGCLSLVVEGQGPTGDEAEE